jgi:1-acyl-sn-glycerol-3-phosphate acyltransferase
MDAEKKLVVFPEAEITADYEELHHMQKAIFHIVLDVQEDLNKKVRSGSNPEPPVVLIPAAIKFSLEDSLESAVSSALTDIGKRLGIKRDKTRPINEQIDSVIHAYLSKVLTSYGLGKADGRLEDIAGMAAQNILERISFRQNIKPEESLSLIEKLYFVRNHSEGDLEIDSVAVDPEAFHCAGLTKPSLRSDFERVERLLILQRMLSHRAKPIQDCRILDFIESEVTGLITPKGRQSCVISPGEPIDVSPFVDEYMENKLSAVRKLREIFMEKLQNKLDSLLLQSDRGSA